jgi:hypothetical protein
MDKHDFPEPAASRNRELPTMIVNRKTYFVDSRLRELRNVVNPFDRIVFSR